MAAFIKSLDGNHLIAYGRRFFPTEPDPNIDIVVNHYYGGDWHDATPAADVVDYRPYYAQGQWADIRATEHRLSSDQLPPGMRQLKLLWPGTALLDRVELRFQ